MRKLLSLAIVLPVVLAAVPAAAQTREQARAECRKLAASHTYREETRTGVTRYKKIQDCVQEKMRASKGKARKTS